MAEGKYQPKALMQKKSMAGRISEIFSGKRAITADTALRLGKYFDVSAETWLNLQTDYDLRVARRTVWPKIESRIRVHASC